MEGRTVEPHPVALNWRVLCTRLEEEQSVVAVKEVLGIPAEALDCRSFVSGYAKKPNADFDHPYCALRIPAVQKVAAIVRTWHFDDSSLRPLLLVVDGEEDRSLP